ncbi:MULTISPECIES: apolipoprotein N-acyltransferase [unclassified Streptomyces]|uniref:apolipoprotein N-acyltransferase n=1 Tax=unclassified Streptomyces TaxID=2593676 RepID=UPI000DB9287E|nr:MULTISPECIES: apolipoprotein N-acyltransferase [unclassified Streptomyces]MYT75749.1 apolipoprotein N-acyltransferase [Streptomyces sp. SID8367]RAJ87160.1 apolipoprotein N-acyltransferase [Streptomyces sp. PsTaAH-137]
MRGRWQRLGTSPWWRGAAAAGAGALPAPAFPAPALWWLAYVALVPWMLLARSAPTPRRAALDGWLGGLGFMLAVHHWLLPSLHVFTVVLAALLGALWAPWGWLLHRLLHDRPSPRQSVAALVAVPSAWLMIELVRSWQGLGGPWGMLGSSQWQVGPALRLASVGGVWLLSLLVVVVNTAVTLLVIARGARTPAVAGLVATVAVTTAASAWAPRPQTDGTARVAVVQAGTIVGAERRFDREEALTRRLAGRDVDLVVWGESSVGFDLAARPDLARRLAALSRLVDADLLVNVDARRSGGIYKSSVLIGRDGPTGPHYDKMRLVPFGEYVPARSLLGWATSVGKAAGEDRRRGTHQVVMDAGALRFGPLVCFESAFPDMTRNLTRDGAQVLLAQSSTSTFQHSWAPEQHASLAALRAAESGRPMVHATLTGVSAVYGPDGSRVGPWLGTSSSTARVYAAPTAHGTTLYVRFGDWPVHVAGAVLLVLGATEAARRLRHRSLPPHAHAGGGFSRSSPRP